MPKAVAKLEFRSGPQGSVAVADCCMSQLLHITVTTEMSHADTGSAHIQHLRAENGAGRWPRGQQLCGAGADRNAPDHLRAWRANTLLPIRIRPH